MSLRLQFFPIIYTSSTYCLTDIVYFTIIAQVVVKFEINITTVVVNSTQYSTSTLKLGWV